MRQSNPPSLTQRLHDFMHVDECARGKDCLLLAPDGSVTKLAELVAGWLEDMAEQARYHDDIERVVAEGFAHRAREQQ